MLHVIIQPFTHSLNHLCKYLSWRFQKNLPLFYVFDRKVPTAYRGRLTKKKKGNETRRVQRGPAPPRQIAAILVFPQQVSRQRERKREFFFQYSSLNLGSHGSQCYERIFFIQIL